MRTIRARVISTETVQAARPRRRTHGAHLRLRVTAAALAGGLALALAGCSGDDGSSAEKPAASPSTEAPSTKASAAEPQESADEPRPVPTSAAELNAQVLEAQVAAGSGHMEIAYAGPGLEQAGVAGAAADVIYGADGVASAMRMTVDVVEQALEFLVVDDTLYVSLGQEAPGMWMSMSRDEIAAEPAMASMLQMIDGIDPAAAARAVEGAVTGFEHRAGDGVDIFTTTLDPSKLDTASVGLPGADEQALALVESMTTETTVSQADGLPTQTVSTSTVDGVDIGVTTTFSQWGQVAPITAPPADAVVPYAEMEQ